MKKFGGSYKLKQGSLKELMKLVDVGVEGVSKLYDKYNKMHGTNIKIEEKIKQNALDQKEMLGSINPKRKTTFDKKIYKNTDIPQEEQTLPIVNLEGYNNEVLKTSKPEDKFKMDQTGKLIKIVEEDKRTPEPVKKEFTPPEKIPDLKLSEVYKYDTIQLIDVLRNLEYKKENLIKFIDIIAVVRKKSQLKIYDFPEITNALKFIKNNIENIPQTYLVSLAYSLSKIQNFDPDRPSLDSDNMVYEILNHINVDKLNIRVVANLVYSLQTFQTKNPRVYNFNDYMTKLEVKIIDMMVKNPKGIDGQTLSNIVLSYAKTQNGSEEFYRLLSDIISNKIDLLKPQDIAIILYSYANNTLCTEKILEVMQDVVKKNMFRLLGKELCNIARAYYMRKLLDKDMTRLITDAFIQRHEEVNALDLAHFYLILADENNLKFLNYCNKCLETLFFTFGGAELGIISKKAEFIQKNNPQLYKKFQNQVRKLINKESIKGFDLKEIYTNIKDLPYDTKYNFFREEVEKHLEKLKYY
jgi:hypothetical protein